MSAGPLAWALALALPALAVPAAVSAATPAAAPSVQAPAPPAASASASAAASATMLELQRAFGFDRFVDLLIAQAGKDDSLAQLAPAKRGCFLDQSKAIFDARFQSGFAEWIGGEAGAAEWLAFVRTPVGGKFAAMLRHSTLSGLGEAAGPEPEPPTPAEREQALKFLDTPTGQRLNGSLPDVGQELMGEQAVGLRASKACGIDPPLQ